MVGRLLDPAVIAALRELPDRYRIVVYLADLEGLGYQQITALTGIPLGSVKSCLHRARADSVPNSAPMHLMTSGLRRRRALAPP